MPTHSVVRSGYGWRIFNWAVILSEVRYHNLIEQIDVGSSMAALSVYVDATAEAAFEVGGDEEGYEGTDDQHEYFSSRYNEKQGWVIVRAIRIIAFSRGFLVSQLWIVNYYVKCSSNNLSNEKINTGVSREMKFQK